MNKNKFLKQLNKDTEVYNREYYKDVIKASTQTADNDIHLIICMEELAELSQALAKYLKGEGDEINILEEVADVLICIGYIQEIVGLYDDEIVSAINVKIDRIQKILDKQRKENGDDWDIEADKKLLKQKERNNYYTGEVLSKHKVESLLAALDSNNPENVNMLEKEKKYWEPVHARFTANIHEDDLK